MKYATTPQISKIHVLLTKSGFIDDKKNIISNLTNGRTESTKLISFEEARKLIVNLCEYDPTERIKSLIFSLAYQAGIIYGSTGEDKRINAAKLNMFLKERGSVKMELNLMTYPELVKTHRQFEAIVKNTKKSEDKKQANRVVSNLLNELNLTTI